MRIPLWLKVLWTLWVMAWAPVYWRHYGLQNFLFFCDIGNLFIAAGLWLESPLIFSWQATGLLLFQSLFTIDLARDTSKWTTRDRRNGIYVRPARSTMDSPP
jgi:hypothetical protein